MVGRCQKRDAQCTGTVRLSDFDLIGKVVCGLVAFQCFMTVDNALVRR
jgi:hypothetical protein